MAGNSYGSESSIPSYYNDAPDRPLFGESRPRDRIINIVVAVITGFSVAFVLISAFVHYKPPRIIDVFFAFCIILLCITHAILIIEWVMKAKKSGKTGVSMIFWYRKGDLEPKFRSLIYYNTFAIFALCLCACLYFYGVDK